MKRYFITVALAAALLALIVVRILKRSHTQGLSVGIVVTRCETPEHLRMMRLLIDDDGNLFINNRERVSAGELPRRLADIYETRWEKVLFFEADNSVPYHQVIETIDLAQSSVPRLNVKLITPSSRKDCDNDGILRRIPPK